MYKRPIALSFTLIMLCLIEGDRLSLKTEPNKSPIDGREGVGILTFERVKGSRPQ